MDPRQNSPESMPNVANRALERPPARLEHALPAPEVALGRRNEATERRLGQQVESIAQAPVTPVLPSLPQPVVDTSTAATQPTQGITTSPVVAADEDLIEKEWVDKAKQVIASTRDDPYRREQEVKKLQIEYVRKRYGREIGDTDD